MPKEKTTKKLGNKKIKESKPSDLLHPSRIDLIPKILYIRNKEEGIGSNFLKQMYTEHIKSFNDFKEDKKTSKEDFVSSFDNLIDSVKKKGYDKKKGIIPVTNELVAGHGAHRIATSFYFNKKVPLEFVNSDEQIKYNYSFFRKRGLSEKFLEEMALRYSKIKGKNLYFCIFWGTSVNKINSNKIEKYLQKRNIVPVFDKQAKLTETGKKNTIIACYEGENWLGERKKGYPGAMKKVGNCFRGDNRVRVYLLESKDIEEVRNLKEEIRDDLGLDKHALHISDTPEETERLCELFFNNNSLFLLNNSRKAFLIDIPLEDRLRNIEDIAITSSFVLNLYGIREARDVDYISEKGRSISGLNSHNKLFNKQEIKDLVYDPENYFIFKGIKFLTLEKVLEFKQKRGEPKDARDVKLIKKFLDKSKGFDIEKQVLKLKFKITSLLIKLLKMTPQGLRDRFKRNEKLKKIVRRALN